MKGGEDMMETLTGRGEREVEALRGDVVEFCKKISGDRLLPGSPVSAQDHRLCPRPPSLPKTPVSAQAPVSAPQTPQKGAWGGTRGEGWEGKGHGTDPPGANHRGTAKMQVSCYKSLKTLFYTGLKCCGGVWRRGEGP